MSVMECLCPLEGKLDLNEKKLKKDFLRFCSRFSGELKVCQNEGDLFPSSASVKNRRKEET